MSEADDNIDIDATNASNKPSKKQKTTSVQEKKEVDAAKKKFMSELAQCAHVLHLLTADPQKKDFWERKEFKLIRQEIAVIQSQPELYVPVCGDILPDHSVASGGEDETAHKTPALTQGYIKAIASFKEWNEDDELPILQVSSAPDMSMEQSSRKSKSSHIHMTHLRLCDGSNDEMVGRLSMHLAHDGKKLSKGDIIQATSFTPLTYTPSEAKKQYKSPAIVIHQYRRVGYAPVAKVNNPLHCTTIPRELKELSEINSLQFAGSVDEYEKLEEVECTAETRYCSLYGVNTVVCVCETDPVDKVDLEVVREYCYFATSNVKDMKNGHIRNMLYWWYMTNIYHICGKGKRAPVPKCLLAAIRKAHPEENGLYKVYKP